MFGVGFVLRPSIKRAGRGKIPTPRHTATNYRTPLRDTENKTGRRRKQRFRAARAQLAPTRGCVCLVAYTARITSRRMCATVRFASEKACAFGFRNTVFYQLPFFCDGPALFLSPNVIWGPVHHAPDRLG